MSKRVNMLTGKKEPKKSANERTWFRWRLRRGTETQDDNLRIARYQDAKDRILQMFGLGKEKEIPMTN